nr:MAG TPA: hypothetical protein [Caudoviricetes sp.]
MCWTPSRSTSRRPCPPDRAAAGRRLAAGPAHLRRWAGPFHAREGV